MIQTRRQFLVSTAATATVALLPPAAWAAGRQSDVFKFSGGSVTVHPVQHASLALETAAGTIYVDPVGEPDIYADLPRPDLILVTHEHGDHFKPDTLAALVGDGTRLITNPAVLEKLPADLKARAGQMANGDASDWNGIGIDAIPAYNTTESRTNFHPRGRDNGYVLGLGGFRVYISGDTEDIDEMRALQGIDLAFVCMNLPFTMSAEQAASAVAEFRPKFVYPYHYRGRDDGTQDPKEFARLVGEAAEVKYAPWYGTQPA